ncbi:furin-like protease kpc-1 [Convolutriloba macropyga]|uniref:furin-like protease kpc-1 n=1 Tax=Convolutriloba macropyga TaxID=536237 RepID=UPI003F522DB2
MFLYPEQVCHSIFMIVGLAMIWIAMVVPNLSLAAILKEPSEADQNSLDADHESDDAVSFAEKSRVYTDEIVIHCDGSLDKAYQIADEHDLVHITEIFENHHLFQVPHRHRRRADDAGSTHDLHSGLRSNSKVLWFEQQYVLSRQKRDNEEPSVQPTISVVADARLEHNEQKRLQGGNISVKMNVAGKFLGGEIMRKPDFKSGQLTLQQIKSKFVAPNDPSWLSQWYLHRSLNSKIEKKEDMNVIEAWVLGYTGKGVVITIIDDGVEGKHKDLAQNFDPKASYDINDNDKDATPRYDSSNINKHGTRCAGEVAASINNNNCVVGVAYNSKVGGIRMLDGQITDSVEARSLSYKPEYVDIYSSSWGPDDDGKTVDGPKVLALRAFLDGVRNGRKGKGSIFVWAAGNGGRHQDDCNCDGYTTSIYTLSIASTTEKEQFPWYSERCSSTLASTYSSGSSGEKSIVTTDLRNKCTDKHTGTSASAPLAAGICALALEANSNLTWRDMQHIVLRTARPLTNMQPKSPDSWKKNGVGRLVSHSYGYGLMDAGAMVRMARQWKTVPQQRECVNNIPTFNPVKIAPHTTHEVKIKSTGCGEQVMYLEHVVAIVTLAIPTNRGKLSIQLTSPEGTVSQLLFPRNKDNGKDGFNNWQFMSVHHWEEPAVGEWKFTFRNDHPTATATLSKVELKLYGTLEDPSVFTQSMANISYSPYYAEWRSFSENGGLNGGRGFVLMNPIIWLSTICTLLFAKVL